MAFQKKTLSVHLHGIGYLELCCLWLPYYPASQKYFYDIGQFAGRNHNTKRLGGILHPIFKRGENTCVFVGESLEVIIFERLPANQPHKHMLPGCLGMMRRSRRKEKRLSAKNNAALFLWLSREKPLGLFSGSLSGFCTKKRSNGTRSQLRQEAVFGGWGPPQQAILQSEMQSVYHSALLAICCFLIVFPLPILQFE